jgi:LCP family protein required for cell wall assembly
MQPKKYDSFRPKRATNIDGFFAKPVSDRPRQPIFRTPPANPQQKPAKLADMPRRSTPQNVLTSSAAATATATAYPLDGTAPRRRRHAPEGPEQMPKKARKKHSWKWRFKRTGMVIGCLVILAGVWFGFKFYRDIANLTGNNNPFSLLSVFHPVPLKNQDGRVNILVAANSADDPGHNGANLTDSIMVLSIDTKKNTALILSVPRDLWVEVPGVGHTKINDAYPNGGMGTLQKVVEDNLGMTIDYRALVNYGAFRDLVNAVGGITITIKSDDPRGIYDPDLDYTTRYCCALAKYPNGPVTLNGKQALNLARARGEAYGSYGYAQSDFARTMYQREMLLAVKNKAVQTSVIANPLKVTKLVDAVGNNITTDLQLNEIETLYSDMKKINDNQIGSYNINTLKGSGTTMLQNYTSPDGESALIPAAGLDDFSDIQQQIRKLFSANPLVREGATVVVLNATDTTGLAAKQENLLYRKGMNVSADNAVTNQATTTLIDNSNGDMPNTLAYLKKQYHPTITTSRTLTAGYPGADFILVLGQDAVPKTTTTGN